MFENPKYAINTQIGIFGHNYKSRNVNHFAQDSHLYLNELAQNKHATLRFVYKSEFMFDNKDKKYIDMNEFNPDDHMKSESPLLYHVYNNNTSNAFKITFRCLW